MAVEVGALIAAQLFGSLFSAGMQSSTATDVSKMQTDAALQAAQLQKDTSDKALAFLEKQYGISMTNKAPYLNEGKSALLKLSSALGLDTSNANALPGGMTLADLTGTTAASTATPTTSTKAPVAVRDWLPSNEDQGSSGGSLAPYNDTSTPTGVGDQKAQMQKGIRPLSDYTGTESVSSPITSAPLATGNQNTSAYPTSTAASSFGTGGTDAMVWMKNPKDGSMNRVPQSQVAYFQQKGAQVVQ